MLRSTISRQGRQLYRRINNVSRQRHVSYLLCGGGKLGPSCSTARYGNGKDIPTLLFFALGTTLTACCATNNDNNNNNGNNSDETTNQTLSVSTTACETKPPNGKRKNNEEERYTLLNKKLGEGAFGVVRLALDKHTGKQVAIKYIKKDAGNPISLQDVHDEIRVMKLIKKKGGNRNLMEMVDVIEKPRQTLIVTELIKGGEVFDRLISKGIFSEADVAKMASSLAVGLNFLHEKCDTSHLDIKPENIMLSSDDQDAEIKIVDFGCASPVVKALRKRGVGTTVYWSPENFEKNSPRDNFGPESDLFAVGVCLYICLYGSHPFDPNGDLTEEEIEQNIRKGAYRFDDEYLELSPSAKNVIRSLLESDPDRRLTSAEMLRHPWVKGKTASRAHIEGSAQRLEAYQKARRKVRDNVLAVMMEKSLQQEVSHQNKRSLVLPTVHRGLTSARDVIKKLGFDHFDNQGTGFISAKDMNMTKEEYEAAKGESTNNDGDSGQGFQLKEIEEIFSEIPQQTFQKGEVVISQGAIPDRFYFIMSGRADVFVQSCTDAIQTTNNPGRLVATLGPGSFFGEEGVLDGSGRKRSATVCCAKSPQKQQPLEVIVISKSDFESLQQNEQFQQVFYQMEELIMGRALGRLHSLFVSSPDVHHTNLQTNQVLFEEGDPSNLVFVIDSGNLSLYDNTTAIPHESQPQPIKICDLGTGAMLGETGVMENLPRNATAVCTSLEGCSVSHMAKEPFENLLGQLYGGKMIRRRKMESFRRSESLKKK